MNTSFFTRRPGKAPLPAGHSSQRSVGWSPLSLLSLLSLLTGISYAPAALAQAPSIYDRIHTLTESEFLLGQDPKSPHTADLSVRSFISTVYRPDEGILFPADIPPALSGDKTFCEPQPPPMMPNADGRYLWPPESDWAGSPASTTRKRLYAFLGVSRCETVRSEIRLLAAREMRLRTLAQDLQLIAAGYEQPVMESPTLGLKTITRTRGLVSIWRAGGDTANGNPRGQTVPATGAMAMRFATVGNALLALQNMITGREQLIAAVNRYSLGGYRYARGDRNADWEDFAAPVPGPFEETGTERQYVLGRWLPVETALEAIWEDLRGEEFDPPLEPGDIVTFTVPAEYQALLPDNVRVWAYVEMLKDRTVTGDAGLEWILPEPVLPSLCTDGTACAPIPGGTFPPAPAEGTALCTQPLARLGYLCRPFETPDRTECNDKMTAENGTIILAACTDPEEERVTERGPDSCADIDWRGDTSDPVCSPGAATDYRNTIGNNLCFFNTCLQEQTDDGFMPRDTGITAQAGTSPVISCVRPDPQLGSLDVAPVFRPWAPPPYRPALLVRQLETALCAGMAPSGLSGMCSFPLSQGLHQVGAGVLGPATAVSNRGGERAQAIFDLQDRTDAIGARVGTRLYLDYLTQRADTLAGIVTRATVMLRNFSRASFPQQMCPFNDADGINLLQTDLCQP